MNKQCKACGTQTDEQSLFCPNCGSRDFVDIPENNGQILNGMHSTAIPIQEDIGNGNVIAGIVGAFLFSVIGAAIYFLIYQVGFVAGISGLIMFVLANFGYGLFSGTKSKPTIIGIIASVVATLVMLFAAEYFCISYEIYLAFKDTGITVFDAIKATPEFIKEPEIKSALISDLTFSYVFGAIACVGNIINMVKSKKK